MMKRIQMSHVVVCLFFIIACLLFGGQRLVLAADTSPKEALKEELPLREPLTFWDRFIMIADIDAFYTLSREHGARALHGGSVDAVIAPTYKLDRKSYFILLYEGHYYKKRDFYSDEIGPRKRKEFQSHTIQPMYRVDFGERLQYSLTPSIFYTHTYNKDTDADEWEDGLYNYWDFGGSLEFDARGIGGTGSRLSLTTQYYKRRYPNYASLLSLTGLDLRDPDTNTSAINVEKNEKDYHGVLFKAEYRKERPIGFSWEVGYGLLYKDLDDKLVVDSDGVLSDEKQEDYLHELNLDLWYIFDVGGGLRLGLDFEAAFNRSNQNFYDGRQTLTLADDVFTEDYYDYNLFGIRPNISYRLALFPIILRASYYYGQTRYTDRKARLGNGDYTDKKQRDFEHNFRAEFQYDLTEHWSVIARWDHIAVRSNNQDERVYKYDYTVNNFSIGVTFRY